MLGFNSRRKSALNPDELMGRAKRLSKGKSAKPRRGITSTAVIGGILGVAAAGLAYRFAIRKDARLPFASRSRAVHLEGSINIEKPVEEIYNFWRSFVDLPKVMSFLERIEDKGGDVTHWVARGPLATTLEWDSEVIEDVPNGRIAWQSLEGSEIKTWGDVKFLGRSHTRGTDVIVNLYFEPPGSLAGATVGRFLKGLENAMLMQNLRNLKAYLEAGEIPPGQWRTKAMSGSRPSA
ncbi:SRPBCC family protein [Marinimicrobium sp. ABcell2]|uniref:SRPBCC family protein n=1 Tax=Marinimicrobium sp. ABcell2 TaxID=3069751 RepID=UPI0027B8468A|nr:SRPBCC family protein [Marinimicrobium sp. ABcell2]MDQ2078510.1 SRPBCC family protein [Marinimicrobium sp. ABcell2]